MLAIRTHAPRPQRGGYARLSTGATVLLQVGCGTQTDFRKSEKETDDLRHMETRREQLLAKIDALTTELDDLDVSIKALSPE